MKTILASQNAHKAEEFAHAVNGVEVVPAPYGVEVEENADSFIGNARLKARAYAKALGANTLADDSGLCVDALDGAPGIPHGGEQPQTSSLPVWRALRKALRSFYVCALPMHRRARRHRAPLSDAQTAGCG